MTGLLWVALLAALLGMVLNVAAEDGSPEELAGAILVVLAVVGWIIAMAVVYG